jgi:hypothetical protein
VKTNGGGRIRIQINKLAAEIPSARSALAVF